MRLDEIMTTKVVTIRPDETATAAWTRMRRRDIRHLVVMDHTGVVGVLSERDLGGRTGATRRKNRNVQDLMSARVASAEPGTELSDAAELMREKLIGSLPVLDGDKLVGIVTATDVFEAMGAVATPRLSRAEQQLLRQSTTSKKLGGRPVVRKRDSTAKDTPPRRPGSRQQKVVEPLAGRVPRGNKAIAGRTDTADVPANVRVVGVELDDDDRAYIRLRLGAKLGKFAKAIERVSVRVKDVNGPRGGVDKVCNIKVVISGLPSVVFETQAASLKAAVNGALTGVERAVRKNLGRARDIPKNNVAAVPPGADEDDDFDPDDLDR